MTLAEWLQILVPTISIAKRSWAHVDDERPLRDDGDGSCTSALVPAEAPVTRTARQYRSSDKGAVLAVFDTGEHVNPMEFVTC